MNNNGYIRLSRRIREWVWYKNLNTRAVFLHILLGASWENENVRGFALERGQLLTTIPELATANQLSVQQTKTALSNLQTTGDITFEGKHNISIITVNNYDSVIEGNFQNNRQSTAEATFNQPPKQPSNNRPTLLNNNTRKQEAEKARAAAAEVRAVVGKFNEICKSLPRIQADAAVGHKAELIRRAREIMGSATFEQLFALVESSDFLTRRSSKSSFRADFEWIMKPDNLVKILSGAYSENYSAAERKSAAPSAADYNEPLYD